jgi:hypothetical protein
MSAEAIAVGTPYRLYRTLSTAYPPRSSFHHSWLGPAMGRITCITSPREFWM